MVKSRLLFFLSYIVLLFVTRTILENRELTPNSVILETTSHCDQRSAQRGDLQPEDDVTIGIKTAIARYSVTPNTLKTTYPVEKHSQILLKGPSSKGDEEGAHTTTENPNKSEEKHFLKDYSKGSSIFFMFFGTLLFLASVAGVCQLLSLRY